MPGLISFISGSIRLVIGDLRYLYGISCLLLTVFSKAIYPKTHLERAREQQMILNAAQLIYDGIEDSIRGKVEMIPLLGNVTCLFYDIYRRNKVYF